jgi:hypothetical protein
MKTFFLISMMVLSYSCQPKNQFNDEMQEKIVADVKRDDISGRMHMFFRALDNKNWKEVREILADEVTVDMGEGTKKLKAEEVVDYFKKNLTSYNGTQHQVSNYGITVDKNSAHLMFVATSTYHQKKKGASKSLYGSYVIDMTQPKDQDTNWEWKITHLKYKNNFTINL